MPIAPHDGAPRAPRPRDGRSSFPGDIGPSREPAVISSAAAEAAETPPAARTSRTNDASPTADASPTIDTSPSAETPPFSERAPAALGSFEDLYEEHFDFVWRAVRRLGVPAASVDDAVQDVFVVVHRRAAAFEGRSSVRTWLFGIVLHVARAHRRRKKHDALDDPDALADPRATSPHALVEAAEARRVLHEVLDKLDDDRREVFVLIELSEMTAPEAAEALGVELNTVYSRLRAARQAFDAEVQRRAARTAWRLP